MSRELCIKSSCYKFDEVFRNILTHLISNKCTIKDIYGEFIESTLMLKMFADLFQLNQNLRSLT